MICPKTYFFKYTTQISCDIYEYYERRTDCLQYYIILYVAFATCVRLTRTYQYNRRLFILNVGLIQFYWPFKDRLLYCNRGGFKKHILVHTNTHTHTPHTYIIPTLLWCKWLCDLYNGAEEEEKKQTEKEVRWWEITFIEYITVFDLLL